MKTEIIKVEYMVKRPVVNPEGKDRTTYEVPANPTLENARKTLAKLLEKRPELRTDRVLETGFTVKRPVIVRRVTTEEEVIWWEKYL